MASAFTKIRLLRLGATRSYSAQTVPITGTLTYDVKTTVLPNKVIVASAENESPISRVSILFRAGSRNETADNLGTTYVLRIAVGNTTRSNSQFAITRHVAQVGASLSCTTDREVIAYNLVGTRRAVQETFPFLRTVATEQLFNPWEMSDNDNRLKYELDARPLPLKAIDLLHKAAYRTGLGNSLYIPKYNINKISSETLQHYVACNFTTNRAAVVGIGVNHEDLVQDAQSLQLESGGDETGPGIYKGGEIRSDKGGEFAYSAVVGQGGALKNPKEVAAFAVLQRAYGLGPSIKYGSANSSILKKAIGDVDEPHKITAININYSDSGLFGVFITGSANIAGNLVAAAAKTLKSGSVTEADINRGKNQLKVDVLFSLENSSNALENIGQQAVLTGAAQSPSEIAALVDTISAADVQAVARKLASSKLSIASVGNLTCVPYLDDLQ